MRNRAKCKLCKDIIESFHQHDYVACKCGEIAVDGGQHILRAAARDYMNFLRVDDEGNEIIVKVIENGDENKKKEHEKNDDNPIKPSKSELMEQLTAMIDNIEKLPPHALTLPITHYDFYSALLLLSAILRSEDLT
jgi:hypothetical protein